MKSGIYLITNKINGKMYAGSAVDLKRREKAHLCKLKNNKHYNTHLQNSYNKYGENKFTFKIILFCKKEDLLFYEQRAIDGYGVIKKGYNIAPIAGSCLGKKHTEESKKKMSEGRKGIKCTEEAKKKIGNANRGRKHTEESKKKMRGRKHTEESKKKMSGSRKGRFFSEGHKKKIGNANKGKKHTEEAKKKIGNANRGRKHTEESKKKIGNANKGKKHTEEAKKKMSEAHTGENSPNWGKKFSEEHKKKLSEANKKPIVVYKKEKFINEYKSLTECAKELNLTIGNISKVLTKKRKTCGGYTFEYKDK